MVGKLIAWCGAQVRSLYELVSRRERAWRAGSSPSSLSLDDLPANRSRRVLLIVHDPVGEPGGDRLQKSMGWNDPGRLCQDLIEDLWEVSHERARFEVVDRILVDEFPAKEDGFRYTSKEFVRAVERGTGFHEPDRIDYQRVLDNYDLLWRVAEGELDEVWMFGFPYAGYYESVMAGPGAYWCNAPPLKGTSRAGRRFIIMGFNYGRGVGEMLESMGHRTESIMTRVFAQTSRAANLWERFTRYDLTHPGKAEVGTVHFAPNSERDYDWGNRRSVASRCDDWLAFPAFSGKVRWVNCDEWGGGDIRAHHRWWFEHLPHVDGEIGGIYNNWWAYVLDPDII